MELSAASKNGTAILYQENFWTGKKALIINGTPATKIGKKQFSFTAADGKATFYTVQGSFISGVKVEISDPKETVVLAQNMWYDWVILVLSLVGILPGVIFCGAVGGFFSALCCFLAAAADRHHRARQCRLGRAVVRHRRAAAQRHAGRGGCGDRSGAVISV